MNNKCPFLTLIVTFIMLVNTDGFVSALPLINFTLPTPESGSSTTNTSLEINVSIVESNLNSVIYNWNNINYTLYNDSLVLMYNFENLSALGENSTYIADLSKNSYNGTVSGSTAFWNSSGKYGGSYQFSLTTSTIGKIS